MLEWKKGDTMRSYCSRFRAQSTEQLIKGYPRYSTEFKAIARDELNKRRVAAKKLPYIKKTVARRSNPFSFGGF